MADVTQQTDQYLFECATSKSESAPNVSKDKSMSYVVDLNQGSYNSGIVSIDATNQINGAKGFASLRDSYITVPYVVSINNGGGALTATPANITQFIGALKANTSTIIDKVQIELNGKTLVTPSGYLSHWNNLRAMTEWSDDDTKTHGASALLYPDDVTSIGFSNAASTSGDGYLNNANNPNVALGSSNTTTTEYPYNSGFVKRQLCNPPVVSSNGTAVNPFPWASTHSATAKILCQNSGKGATVVGSGAASGSVAQFFYMLRIRLVDIHPIFKTLDLVANPQLKL
jgi:hypothetical protein